MPKVAFTVPHTLSSADAQERLKSFLPRIQEAYKDMVKDMENSWNGNSLNFSFKTLGFTFKGSMLAEDHQVRVDMDVPLAAMMVKGRIEQEFRTGLERLLRA